MLIFPHRQQSTSQSQRINPTLGSGVLRDWRPRLPPELLRHPPPPNPPQYERFLPLTVKCRISPLASVVVAWISAPSQSEAYPESSAWRRRSCSRLLAEHAPVCLLLKRNAPQHQCGSVSIDTGSWRPSDHTEL